MTLTNETQTIDADALRARLAETPADLRERIEAALRARDPDARVIVSGIPGDDVAVALGESVVTARVGSARALAPTGTEAAALAALAVAVGLSADGHDPRAEVDALESLVARQADILTGVANALRGDPGPLASHGHHDLAERVASMVAVLEVTRSSLEAASSGRRVTACDDIERLQRERDALRAAAREYLDALEAPAPVWDADESEHDGHAARLEVARAALRALVGGAS